MSPNGNEKQMNGFTREDFVAIIEAARKPVKSEKEQREEVQAEADRKQMGEILKQAAENKAANQKACSHMRPNGSTTAVWTGDPINKLYCQACAKWIGSDEPELFNRLYQLAI